MTRNLVIAALVLVTAVGGYRYVMRQRSLNIEANCLERYVMETRTKRGAIYVREACRNLGQASTTQKWLDRYECYVDMIPSARTNHAVDAGLKACDLRNPI